MSLILNRPDGNIVLVGWQKPLFHAGVQQDTAYGSLRSMLCIQQHLAKPKMVWMDFFIIIQVSKQTWKLKRNSQLKKIYESGKTGNLKNAFIFFLHLRKIIIENKLISTGCQF